MRFLGELVVMLCLFSFVFAPWVPVPWPVAGGRASGPGRQVAAFVLGLAFAFSFLSFWM